MLGAGGPWFLRRELFFASETGATERIPETTVADIRGADHSCAEDNKAGVFAYKVVQQESSFPEEP